jgi:hypothetical protein
MIKILAKFNVSHVRASHVFVMFQELSPDTVNSEDIYVKILFMTKIAKKLKLGKNILKNELSNS